MSMLGVMLDATYALFGMEMNYEHVPVTGRDNCREVKWTPDSLTRICWYSSDQDRIEFSTVIHMREGMHPNDRERFVDLLNTVDPACEGPMGFTRNARVERDDLVVESRVVIEDASYVGEVEQAYMQALQDVIAIEAAVT